MNRTIALLALALGLIVHGAQGCGIDWSLPKNHFDGVNEFGCVSVWENIGNIDIGDGLVLPLNINFRSDRTTSSSTLGSGWILALLDSNIIQVDERTFMMYDPAGPFRLFWRDSKNPSILSGQAGWKAEIQGDLITAWTDCGAKLVFNKGRITSMQLKDKVFTYNYQNGQISEILQGNTPILMVKKEPISGKMIALRLSRNREIGIELGTRPCVQTVAKQSVVSGFAPTLNLIARANGLKTTFDFAVDDKFHPSIIINQTRKIVGDNLTKFMLTDGNLVQYSVGESLVRFQNSEIERKHFINGQVEVWYHDSTKGIEKVVTADGNTEVRSWFVSGRLAGKPRSIYFGNEGYKYIYDELGDCKSKNFKNGDILKFERSAKNGTCVLSLERQNGSSVVRTVSVSGDKQWEFISGNSTNNKTVSYSYNNASGFLKIDESKPNTP